MNYDRSKVLYDLDLYRMYFNSDIGFLELMDQGKVKNYDNIFTHISDHLCKAHAFMFVYSESIIPIYHRELRSYGPNRIFKDYKDLIHKFERVLESYSKAFESYYEIEYPNASDFSSFIDSEKEEFNVD